MLTDTVGGPNGIRTHDLRNASAALFPLSLSYRPLTTAIPSLVADLIPLRRGESSVGHLRRCSLHLLVRRFDSDLCKLAQGIAKDTEYTPLRQHLRPQVLVEAVGVGVPVQGHPFEATAVTFHRYGRHAS